MANLYPENYDYTDSHALKSAQFCSTMNVRGFFTSDNLYTWQNLPSDMTYKMPAGQNQRDWEDQFKYCFIPEQEDALVKSQQASINKGFNLDEQLQDLLPKREEKKQYAVKSSSGGEFNALDELKESLKAKDNTMRESELDLPGHMEVDSIGEDHLMKSYSALSRQSSVMMKVDPILDIERLVGYNGKTCKDLLWMPQVNEKTIIFATGGVVVAMDVNTEKQRYFFGHTDNVSCFAVSQDGRFLASGQEGKSPLVRIWDYDTGRCLSTISTDVSILKCLSISCDRTMLATVGKDRTNREQIVVWDISQVCEGFHPTIVARQISDYNILNLKFSPFEPLKMISCGKENIRFWRIKNKFIQGSAVVLNQHARNTIFTDLSFDCNFKSSDPDENLALKRVHVGSKHGCVFQINYQKQKLEKTFQLHDGAIHALSVNAGFCVTVSEDQYLRVWKLDFSELFMEAKHEGEVTAVSFSPDGVQIICGTINGALGHVDMQNERYRTILRSHSDEIVAADYNRLRNHVITVSRDKMIRIWDLDQNFSKTYEFLSINDQALCVSSHPSLALFACGFESGKLRIFDIDKTCVGEVFNMFNVPITQVEYTSDSRLLLACSKDGFISIHNAQNEHQPIKMLDVDFSPEHTSLAVDSQNTVFASIGNNGSMVNVWDSFSFQLANQIPVKGHIITGLTFSPQDELVVLTEDCSIKFFSLEYKGGRLMKELTHAHRGGINSISFSNNGAYFITGGRDKMVKVWDSEFEPLNNSSQANPFYFQSFIGHTYPIQKVMFNLNDNSQCITVGGLDNSVFIWSFKGDLSGKLKTKSQLERQRVRASRKAISPNEEGMQREGEEEEGDVEISEGSEGEGEGEVREVRQDRVLSEAGNAAEILPPQQLELRTISATAQELLEIRGEKGLTYLSFVSNPDPDIRFYQDEVPHNQCLEPRSIIGYNGEESSHNIVWNQAEGCLFFSTKQKIVREDLQTKEQKICFETKAHISCFAVDQNYRRLAIAHGTPNTEEFAEIVVMDIQEEEETMFLQFHDKGVQGLQFSNDGSQLVSVGRYDERLLAVWAMEKKGTYE